MLKWAWYGWRLVSSSEEGSFRNVTPTSCGPAVTRMRAFKYASAVWWSRSDRGGVTVSNAIRSRSSSTSSSAVPSPPDPSFHERTRGNGAW